MDSIEIKAAFSFLHENLIFMSLSQIDLIKSMEKQFKKKKELSSNQQNVLSEIRKYLKTQETMQKNDKKKERMKRTYKPITVDLLIEFMVTNGILTPREAWLVRRTGICPDDILDRLRAAELKGKN